MNNLLAELLLPDLGQIGTHIFIRNLFFLVLRTLNYFTIKLIKLESIHSSNSIAAFIIMGNQMLKSQICQGNFYRPFTSSVLKLDIGYR